MATTPSSITVEIDFNSPAIKEALRIAEEVGHEAGLDQGRQEILKWIEDCYINDAGRPDRGTPEAEALLEVAKNAAKHISKLSKRDRHKSTVFHSEPGLHATLRAKMESLSSTPKGDRQK